jgi:hypothetical protein
MKRSALTLAKVAAERFRAVGEGLVDARPRAQTGLKTTGFRFFGW